MSELKAAFNAPKITNDDYAIVQRNIGNNVCFDIESYGLNYVDMNTHHGMQCNHHGGTKEYDRIFAICEEINKLTKELHSLNNQKSNTCPQ